MGLETLAAAISEEVDTIMDVYEPYLMQIGLLARTSRGRQLKPSGMAAPGPDAAGRGSAEPDAGAVRLGRCRPSSAASWS